jgi:RNA polymerase primary sigma factor
MNMFAVGLTSRGSPATRNCPDLDRVILFPRPATTGPADLEGPVAGSPRGRQIDGEPTPGLRVFTGKTRKSRKADIERARRLLATKLTYIAHPSFDDPSAHGAILAASPGSETPRLSRTPVTHGPDTDSSRRTRLPSREQEAHQFRKMNYLKCLARRTCDRIDPDSPDRRDLDKIERLLAEALKLKNQIVETHLRLVVSVAKKRVRASYDMPERISDGTFAMMHAVDRFNFALGNRFSTYATWAIYNELTQRDRREWCRRKRFVPLSYGSLAAADGESEQYEQNEARDERNRTVERLLRRLDRRERWIMVNRHGLGGVPEQTLKQIGMDLGISKERARQLEERAHAKLRVLARLEAIEPADF